MQEEQKQKNEIEDDQSNLSISQIFRNALAKQQQKIEQQSIQNQNQNENEREDLENNINQEEEEEQKQQFNCDINEQANNIDDFGEQSQIKGSSPYYLWNQSFLNQSKRSIQEFQEKFEKLLNNYFMKKSEFKEKYLQFWEQNKDDLDKFYEYLKQQQKNLTWEGFKKYVDTEIYEYFLRKITDKIYIVLEEETINFIKKWNFDSVIDELQLYQQAINYQDLNPLTFLNYLISCKHLYTKNSKSELGVTSEDINKQNACFLFQSTNQIKEFLIYFYSQILRGWEYEQIQMNLYQYEEIVNVNILENLKIKQKETYAYIVEKINMINQQQEGRLDHKFKQLEMEDLMNKNQINTKKIHQQSVEIKNYYKIQMEDQLKNEIGQKPSKFFLENQQFKFLQKIEEFTISRIQKIYDRFPKIKNILDPQLIEIIKQFLDEKNNFFSNWQVLAYIFKSLDKISGLIVRNDQELNKYYQILQKQLQELSGVKTEQEQIMEQFRQNKQSGYQTIRNQIAKNKKEYKNLQQQYEATQFEQGTVLRALVYLYFIYNNITIDHRNKLFCVGDISPLKRHFLYNIYQYIQFGEFEFIYFQVLQCLDIILEEKIIFNVGQKYQSATNNILGQFGFTLVLDKYNTQYEILLMLREEAKNQDELIFEKEDIDKQKKNQAESVYTIKQYIKDIYSDTFKSKENKPSKFYLRKISQPNIISRRVIICVAGYTSEKDNMEKMWSQLLSQNPDIEVYSLHYKNQAMQDLIQLLQKKTSKIMQNLDYVNFITSIGADLVTNYLKGEKMNLFSKAYDEATLVGKYLAHLIAKKSIFPNCQISLIGFSLGTQVISGCLQELQKFHIKDVLYDVIMLGGVADTSVLNKMGDFNFLSGNLYNFYTYNDWVLYYIFNFIYWNVKPAGLNKVKDSYKVKNHDMTSLINGHLYYIKNLEQILQRTDFYYDYN